MTDQYQCCTRCVMDNESDASIVFDENGYCNYCRDVEKRKGSEYFPNEEGKKKVEEMVSRMREEGRDEQYDCLVGVSGGIDSSYIIYKGWQYGLRMLAVHIDDGLDNPIATKNLEKISHATKTKIVCIQPDHKEYADILYSLLKASVSNLAIAQDNLIVKALQDFGEKYNIKYILDGNNFAHESILERSEDVNDSDSVFIYSIQKQFGRIPIVKTKFTTLSERYIFRHIGNKPTHIRLLNFMDYNTKKAIDELYDFCGFEYYGGKHYESILTRWMQCYYLPQKFAIDKRKSHFSSLIMSGQITREEAVEELKKPLYPREDILVSDMAFLADYMDISLDELKKCINNFPKKMTDYNHSFLNKFAPVARKFRKLIE